MFFKINHPENPEPATMNPEDLVSSRLVPRSASEVIKPVVAPPPPPPDDESEAGKGLLWKFSGFLNVLLILGCLILVAIPAVGWLFQHPGPLQEDRVVFIPRGSSVNTIADVLYREKVIDSPFFFNLCVYVDGQISRLKSGSFGVLPYSRLKAGEFEFKAHASISDAVAILAEGRTVLHSLTIPEGLTSEQVVERVNREEALTGEIFQMPGEGTLFPDTFKFERGMSRQQLIQNMQREQERILNQIWERRAADIPLKSRRDLLTLASIVEKETGRADERTRVAAVFLNRLARGMKLQSDPTIVYGIAGGKGTLGRGILRSELAQRTPYNTYLIDGLPPGPIANPGRTAMEAVANPSRTKDLYFVADGTGGHVFAETYEQHQRNVARWRQIERTRAASAQQPPDSEIDRVVPENQDEETIMSSPEDEDDSEEAADTPESTAGARARAFDASEGTENDPLLDRGYDLNSPKNVPALEDIP
ncbi:MAG: endolytic transglycosylase MltG [Methylobacteriaceae bacterium]|jgi:UPF0755 protein|nr:endolytic transglycosylase MltG [Methylobacteriaceae bacterium]